MENETIEQNATEEPRAGKNKNLLLIGIVLLVVAFIAISFFSPKPETVNDAGVVVEGCEPGDQFSQTTGEPCDGATGVAGEPCKEGDVYDIVTGEPCV